MGSPIHKRRYEAIILAGGAGTRFGGAKLLSPYRGGLLVHGALRSALAGPVARTVLVTGHDSENVAAAAAAFRDERFPGRILDVVHAKDHAEGMGASLRTGVEALSDEVDGVFIYLGDMPEVPTQIAHVLAHRIGDGLAAVPTHEGRRGHPVLFTRRLFPALVRLEGDQGGRRLLNGLGADLVQSPVDAAGVLLDIDHPDDVPA